MATKSDKVWADAVRRAVHEYHDQKDENGKVKKVRWLNVLAGQLVQRAAAGDVTAMKEIGDRLDGKPHASTSTTIEPSDALADLMEEVYERSRKARGSVGGPDVAPEQSLLHH